MPSIMATLAAQFFWYGVTVLLANGLQLNIKEVTTHIVHTIFVGRIFGVVPLQAIWALGLTIFLWFILNRHKFGEEIMFIGDNAERRAGHGDQCGGDPDQALHRQWA